MNFKENLEKLNISLPEPINPAGSYVATKKLGNILFISGQISVDENGKLIKGKIGKELVLPLNDSKEAQRFMKQYEKYSKNLNSDYLKQVFFTREPYDLQ